MDVDMGMAEDRDVESDGRDCLKDLLDYARW